MENINHQSSLVELEKIRLLTPYTQTSLFFSSWWSEGQCALQPLLGNLVSSARSRLISCWISQFTYLLCYSFTLLPTGLSNIAQPFTVHLVIHLTWRLIIKPSWYGIFMILLSTIKGETSCEWVLLHHTGSWWNCLLSALPLISTFFGWGYISPCPPTSFRWSEWCYIIAGNLKRHADCGS